MNVLSACWEELFQAWPVQRILPAERPQWERVVADCRRVHMTNVRRDREGVGRVACRFALSVPARSEAIVWARVPPREGGPEDWVLVEPRVDCQQLEEARGLAVVD